MPLQALDAEEYGRLLALAYHGSPLGELLSRKASGPYRHRDRAVWPEEGTPRRRHRVCLPALEAMFQSIITALEPLYGTRDP